MLRHRQLAILLTLLPALIPLACGGDGTAEQPTGLAEPYDDTAASRETSRSEDHEARGRDDHDRPAVSKPHVTGPKHRAGHPPKPPTDGPTTCDHRGDEDVPVVGDRRVPFTPDTDVEFIDFFVPHHEMAMQMATQVVERGSDPEVVALAEEIRTAQLEELEILRATRVKLTGSPDAPEPPRDSHADPEMKHMMSLSGPELDYVFLEEMIPHHGSGVPPAHRGESNVCREDLRQLAHRIYDAQSEEIGVMIRLLIERSRDPAPAHHMDIDTHDGADMGLVGDRRVSFTPTNDVEFVDFFILHHEKAILMARQVVERGARDDVRELAARIIANQSEELALMKRIRMQETGSAEPAPPPPDPHQDPEMQRMMALSGDQRQLLLQGALPRLNCYRAPIVASPDLLPVPASKGRQRCRRNSPRAPDRSWSLRCAVVIKSPPAARRLASWASSLPSAATIASTQFVC